MHARITVQLLAHDPLESSGGETITGEEIADAIRTILDAHDVTRISIKAISMQPRLLATSK